VGGSGPPFNTRYLSSVMTITLMEGLRKRKLHVFDTRKRAKLCSECAHLRGGLSVHDSQSISGFVCQHYFRISYNVIDRIKITDAK